MGLILKKTLFWDPTEINLIKKESLKPLTASVVLFICYEKFFINYYGDELGNPIGLYNYEMQVLNIAANEYEPVTVTLKVIP